MNLELLLHDPSPPTLTVNFLTAYCDASVGGGDGDSDGDFTWTYTVPSHPEGSFAVNLNNPWPWLKLIPFHPQTQKLAPVFRESPVWKILPTTSLWDQGQLTYSPLTHSPCLSSGDYSATDLTGCL